MLSAVTHREAKRYAVEASLPPAELPGIEILRERPLRMTARGDDVRLRGTGPVAQVARAHP